MATQTVTYKLDDLTGEHESETDPVSAVEFAVDGQHYEIDLTNTNAGKLRTALAPFVTNARKAATKASTATARTPRVAGAPAKVDREQNAAIRDWARSHGYPVSERGRIAADVQEAYHLGGDAANARIAELAAEQASRRAAVTAQMSSNGQPAPEYASA